MSIKSIHMTFKFTSENKQNFALCISFFCVSWVLLIILAFFLIQCKRFSRIHNISKLVVTFAVLASIFYMLTSTLAGFSRFFNMDNYKNEMLAYIFGFTQLLCLHLGQLMIYFFLLHRIYKGFEGTIYSITWNQLIMFFGLLLFYSIACLGILIHLMWYTIWCQHNDISNSNDFLRDTIWLGITYRIATLAIDLIVSASLLTIFVSKLRRISKNLDALMNADTMSNSSTEMDSHHNIIIYKDNIYTIISKVATLGAIMLVSSQLVLILSLCNWVYIIYKDIGILSLIYDWFKLCHALIGSLSLLLGFEFVNLWYMCLCGKCHKRIKKWCLMRRSYEFTFSGQIQ